MATKRSFDESEHPGNDDTLLHKHARANGTYLGFDSSLEAGSVVKCIILQSSGALEEVSLDLSPTLGQIDEVVGGTPRLEYAFESSGISVISCKSHQEDESIPVNKHKMQPPLKHAALRGDILLVKKNASCGPDNLTAQEWQEFMALDIPDDEDIEGDDEEDVDAEHNDEIFFDYLLQDQLLKFRSENNRDPTEEEMEDLREIVKGLIEEQKTGNDDGIDDDEDDEDVDDEEDEDGVNGEYNEDAEDGEGGGEEEYVEGHFGEYDDDDVEDDDEDEDDEEEEEEGEAMENFMGHLLERLVEKYREENGRDPTEEELEPLRETAASLAEQLLENQKQNGEDDEDEEDEDEEEEEVEDDDDVEDVVEDEEEEEEDEEQEDYGDDNVGADDPDEDDVEDGDEEEEEEEDA